MDPVAYVTVVGAIAVIVAAVITFLGSRSLAPLCERLQAEIHANQSALAALQTRVTSFEDEADRLKAERDHERERAEFYRKWGINARGNPPRTPPEFHKRRKTD